MAPTRTLSIDGATPGPALGSLRPPAPHDFRALVLGGGDTATAAAKAPRRRSRKKPPAALEDVKHDHPVRVVSILGGLLAGTAGEA
jgi:hypothetical protein